jgi:hypothetical protein
VHATGAYDALKLPLLCAIALPVTKSKHKATTPIFPTSFLCIMSSDSFH